jgi:phosphoglucosamine mutase
MRELFGTDGIRGVAGQFPLDPDTLVCIGLAVARYLTGATTNPRIIMGHDTRESGQWIAQCLTGSLEDAGVDLIHQVGVISTPGLAFLTRVHEFDLGIMISASHNPYMDNGIKLFSKTGFKFPDEWEKGIEREIFAFLDTGNLRAKSRVRKNPLSAEGEVEDYIKFLVEQFRGVYRAGRVAMDVCNGSASQIAPMAFQRLGAEVSVINGKPDGKNINQHCGSLHIEALKEFVNRTKPACGVAFDGDADRSLFVTASGRVFDGDYVLYAFSDYFKGKGRLQQNIVVGTVMTNFALEQSLKKRGISLIRAAVGDKYVLEEMRKTGANLGGEPSGHIILGDYHTTGDGILTAIKLAEILSREKTTLDEIAEGYKPYPQILDGFKVKERIPLTSSKEIQALLVETERQLHGNGRLVVRYSGTEPLLRLMVEGEDPEQVNRLVRELKAGLEKIL